MFIFAFNLNSSGEKVFKHDFGITLLKDCNMFLKQ